jgi:transglutaminase-like putative cysteine protease
MTSAPAATTRHGRRERLRGPVARRQRHITVTAAGAALLASLPLATVFAQMTWLVDATLTIIPLCLVAVVLRGLRLPLWVPTAGMIVTLPFVLARLFPSHQEFLAVIPSVGTVRHFGDLITLASTEMRQYTTPAPDRPGFLFLATFGVAMTAIIIDFFAVGLRKPAIAGLPMLAIYSVPVAVREDSVNVLPFVLAVVGFLWLLISDNIDRVRGFGRRFSGDGRGMDVWESSPLAAAGQRLGIIGIVIAVAVPLAVPGMTTGLLDRFAGSGGLGDNGTGNGSGTGVGLYAMLSGNLNRDKSFDMLRVQTTDPNPYYLRMAVAQELNQTGFRPAAITGGQPITDGVPTTAQSPGTANDHAYSASVDIINMDSHYLPVYQRPTRVQQLDKSWMFDPATSVVYSSRQDTRKKRYTFEFVHSEYSAASLRTAPAISKGDGVLNKDTDVPTVPQVAALVTQLTGGKRTQYDRVMALFDYFSPTNGFSYSLRTEQGTSGTQIVDFLTNKRGYCVQYSAALAWLVRQAGYPARVAFGFTRGTGQAGAPVTLTNFNLHAWTEVYFSGYGWIPFDATPATSVAGSVSPVWAPNPSRPQDTATSAPGASPTGSAATQSAGSAGARGTQGQDRGAQGAGVGTTRTTTPRWVFWTGLSLLILLALLAIPGWRRRARRRNRLRSHAFPGFGPDTAPDAEGPTVLGDAGDPFPAARHDAHAAWDELLDTMTDFGIPVVESETPRVTADRLVATALPTNAAGGARLLGSAEERARYARRPMATGELAASVATIHAAFAAKATRRTRLRVAMLPPSTMRRWRATADNALVRASAATARWRAVAATAVGAKRFTRGRSAR